MIIMTRMKVIIIMEKNITPDKKIKKEMEAMKMNGFEDLETC